MKKVPIHKINMELNNNNIGKSNNKTSIDKNNNNKEKNLLDKKDIGKKKRAVSSIYKPPEINPKKKIENDKNKIKKEKNNLIDKNKDIEAHKDKTESFFINSINEIRLPSQLYDISYDILQNV